MMTASRVLAALGLAFGSASAGLQGIGIAAEHYQLEVQIVAVTCTVFATFLQAITKPITGADR